MLISDYVLLISLENRKIPIPLKRVQLGDDSTIAIFPPFWFSAGQCHMQSNARTSGIESRKEKLIGVISKLIKWCHGQETTLLPGGW